MKYVCGKCLRLMLEEDMIRMPFTSENEFWCRDCYDEWDSEENKK